MEEVVEKQFNVQGWAVLPHLPLLLVPQPYITLMVNCTSIVTWKGWVDR